MFEMPKGYSDAEHVAAFKMCQGTAVYSERTDFS